MVMKITVGRSFRALSLGVLCGLSIGCAPKRRIIIPPSEDGLNRLRECMTNRESCGPAHAGVHSVTVVTMYACTHAPTPTRNRRRPTSRKQSIFPARIAELYSSVSKHTGGAGVSCARTWRRNATDGR